MGVILLGYRGSGKTTAGRQLAERLRTTFIDTDDLVIARAGRNVRELFDAEGEAAFRVREAAAVRQALDANFGVIALGGGAILTPATRTLLLTTDRRRIYLHCDADVLHARIAADPATPDTRPRLTAVGSDLDEVRTIVAAREGHYCDVMTHKLDVTHLTPADVVEALFRITA